MKTFLFIYILYFSYSVLSQNTSISDKLKRLHSNIKNKNIDSKTMNELKILLQKYSELYMKKKLNVVSNKKECNNNWDYKDHGSQWNCEV
jgi:hypothetical protein